MRLLAPQYSSARTFRRLKAKMERWLFACRILALAYHRVKYRSSLASLYASNATWLARFEEPASVCISASNRARAWGGASGLRVRALMAREAVFVLRWLLLQLKELRWSNWMLCPLQSKILIRRQLLKAS